MKAWLAGTMALAVLAALVAAPAYADVITVKLEKSFYTNVEEFVFVGTQDGSDHVTVFFKGPGSSRTILASGTAPEAGTFATMPKKVSDHFKIEGTYTITAITNNQPLAEGIVTEIEYDGQKIFSKPTFTLQIKSGTVSDQTVKAGEAVSFTVETADSSVTGVTYSLSDSAPTGATIDSGTGKFLWVPTNIQASAQGSQYKFDIIAAHGAQTANESITITVNQADSSGGTSDTAPSTTSDTTPSTAPSTTPSTAPSTTPSTPPPAPPASTAPPAPPKLAVPASFVTAGSDPQSYVDRYNNEPSFKSWFDENYKQYDSIYHAVGLDEPADLAIPAPFVTAGSDPQSYVDRYNSEPSYKSWFDENYKQYDSIYHAVGLDEPAAGAMAEPPEAQPPAETARDYGECGPGTELVGDTCTPASGSSQGGGCLIATAAYGTEMAPQVQMLREIRDNTVMGTQSGSAFMAGFNEVYYTFSPTIADWERQSPLFQDMVRAFITPMVSSLSIMGMAEGGSDAEVLGLGLSVIALNLGMYVAAPAVLIHGAQRHARAWLKPRA